MLPWRQLRILTSSSHGNKLAVSPASLSHQISCAYINKAKLMPSCQHQWIFFRSTSWRHYIGTLHVDDNVWKGLHLICNEMLRVMHISKSHEKLGNTVRYNMSCKWAKKMLCDYFFFNFNWKARIKHHLHSFLKLQIFDKKKL